MDKLSEEDVYHVADLARIDVTKEEVDAYAKSLYSLLTEVDKIKDIKGYDEEVLVTPIEHRTLLREDVEGESLSFDKVTKNAPKTSGNYIEVPVMVHE